MRHSEFWQLMDGEFGPAYSRTLARDLVVASLGDRTASQALDAGLHPRAVWLALCDAMEVPVDRRWGEEGRARRRPR